MNNTEKITLVMTAVVTVGSTALFAAARMKARKYIGNTQTETIKTNSVRANTLTA